MVLLSEVEIGVRGHLLPVYAHSSETHVCLIAINICNACLIADVSAAGIKDTRGVPAYTAFSPRAVCNTRLHCWSEERLHEAQWAHIAQASNPSSRA